MHAPPPASRVPPLPQDHRRTDSAQSRPASHRRQLCHPQDPCGKVQVKARMPLEPALYRRGLVGGIIVDDEMQVEIGQSPFVDGLEKAEELAMPVADRKSVV